MGTQKKQHSLLIKCLNGLREIGFFNLKNHNKKAKCIFRIMPIKLIFNIFTAEEMS